MKISIQSILLAVVLEMAIAPLHAAPKTWQGQFLSFVWSNPDNWDPVGVPQDGDSLFFEARPVGDGSTLTINDLTNLTVRSLSFRVVNNDAPTTYEWFLTGNELTVTHAIDTGFSLDEDVYIRCPLKLGGNAQFQAGKGSEFFPYVGLHLDSPIDLNGHNLLLVEHFLGGDLDVSGVISGNGNLHIIGDVELEGENGNTFNGTIYLHANFDLGNAELTLDKISGPAVPGPLIISNNCAVKLQRPHQIADTTTVVIHPGGALRLESNTETVSGLTLSGTGSSAALVDSGDATLSVENSITAANSSTDSIPVIKGMLGLPPGNHVIHTSGSQDFALNIEARIIGEGGLTKMGPKGLLLSGNNSFAGDVVLQEGWVEVRHSNGLGANSGGVFLNGAELAVRDAAIGNKTLFVNAGADFDGLGGARFTAWGVASWAGPILLNTNLNVHGMTMTLAGPISGPGGLTFLAPGTGVGAKQLGGTEPNTYTGRTLARATLLELNKPPGVQAFGGPLIVGDGNGSANEVRWLQNYQKVGADVTFLSDGLVNLNGHREDFGPITFNGGEISTGTGELGVYGLVISNPSSVAAVINGRLGLPPGLREFRVSDGGAFPDLRINATVLGAGSLRKTGPGQMWLTVSNTYAGLTTVAEGALSVLDPHGLGASAAGTTVDDGATLEINFTGGMMPEPLALRGAGIAGNGALGVFGNVTLRNPFPAIFAAIDLTTDTTIGVAAGGRFTVDGIVSGIGPLTKAGPGLLVLANINPNTYSGDTFVAEGVLNLSKPNFAISVPGNLIVGPAPLNSSAIARWSTEGGMNSSATATINAGSLLDLNGNGQTLTRLNLNDGGDVQTGAGKLSFPVGGIVNVGSLSLLGAHEGSSISGIIGLPANSALTFGVSAYAPTPPFDLGPELYVSAAIPVPVENPIFERAGLFKTGVGRMQLIGNNSYRGWTDIAEGTLIAAGNNALGVASSGTYVFNSATLELQNNVTVNAENVVLNSTANPALFSWAGDNFWNGLITLQRDSVVGIGAGSSLNAGGVITGTGHFTKIGAGTLTFGGPDHNTFSGETFVNEGILLLNKPLAVTAVPTSLNISTRAGLTATVGNLNSYQVIGNIFVNRGGLLNLNGQVENVDHLWLSEGGDVETSTGVLFLKTGGSIQVVPGAVGDPSVIAGNLDMDAGSHVINVGSSTSATAGPNLEITALMMSTLGEVSLQKNGTGTLRLTASNNYTGSTTINGGVLQVDGSQPGSSVIVDSGTRLMGNGRVGQVEYASVGGPPGVVSPGHSPGILGCANFNFGGVGGVLRIELNGTAAGSGYDQLYSRGPLSSVALGGVTLDATLNFASAVNDQFTIIRKDGFLEITGAFTGLPEGANFYIGGEQFTITYVGGTGNDVVLTRLPTPPRPALIIQAIPPSAVRLLWPVSFADYTLQSTTNLSVAIWTAALPSPVVIGTNNAVTNAASDATRFYRLFKP